MKAPPSQFNSARPAATRNPERTQQRLFEAAFKEFAAKGFAGARVDLIARRAGINKRMLYHYFGDKEDLFREVLRRKLAERQTWVEAMPDDPRESLPYRFDLALKDPDWIRLLEWEALQFAGKRLIDEPNRRSAVETAVERIASRQQSGHLSKQFEARQLLLAMVALTWFPLAFPQLTRLIIGQSVSDRRFHSEHREFLKRFGAAFAEPGRAPARPGVAARRARAQSRKLAPRSTLGNGVYNSKHG
jgi:AcrR family transcriptional regulator